MSFYNALVKVYAGKYATVFGKYTATKIKGGWLLKDGEDGTEAIARTLKEAQALVDKKERIKERGKA